jgi:type III restriction enzyme
MNYELRDFQKDAVGQLLSNVMISQEHIASGDNPHTIIFSAPTASGKTVMMASLIERMMFGGGGLDQSDKPELPRDPSCVFLWLSDSPQLNEQSLNRMMQASDMLPLTNLVVVDQGFDHERFDGGCVYYLNTQKLSKSGLLTRSKDMRNYTIWETIANTQTAIPNHFFVIIDEAHRGMNATAQERKEAESIIQRFLVGCQTEYLRIPPAPIVIGVSATPAKFAAFLSGAKNRITRYVDIPPSAPREAGLIKDYILLEYSETSHSTEWTLLTDACQEYNRFCSEWGAYTTKNCIDPVHPVLVIQVEDAPKGNSCVSRTNLESVVDIVRKQIPEITTNNISHCFDSGKPLTVGGLTIRYIDPSKIQSDEHCRVVLFKMALTTGWDCPRAEVMMSFRRAEDATLIAQLVGRIVRTPLAHKIDDNDELNAVRLVLPRYNRKELAAVIKHLQDDADVIGMEIGTRADFQVLQCAKDKGEALTLYRRLPTYTSKQKRKTTNIRLCLRLADELAIDGCEEVAKGIRSELLNRILAISAERRENPKFLQASTSLGNITYRVMRIENGELQNESNEEVRSIAITERDVDDLFRKSFLTLTDNLAKDYVTRRYCDVGEDDGDWLYKLEAFSLSQDRDVFISMEAAASKLFDKIRCENLSFIRHVCTERAAVYNQLLRSSKTHKIDVPIISDPIRMRIEKDAVIFYDHLFVDAQGEFRSKKLSTWELLVLDEERNSLEFLTWMRNIPRKPGSIAYIYKDLDGKYTSGFPDFVVFRKLNDKIIADLLEPHYGEDSLRKAKGLCEFIEVENLAFGRVEVIRIIDGKPRRIDLVRKHVRDKVLALSDNDAFVALFDDQTYWSERKSATKR